MHRYAGVILAAVVVVAASVAAWRAPDLANSIQDDGFIYFRIAENAAAGHGPVFNPGERVDAATSPVWLWLLAAAAALGVPLHAAAATFGLAAAILAILACGAWALELASGARASSWIVVVLAVSGALAVALDDRVLLYAFSGMETLLCAAAWLWATRALVRRWVNDEPLRGAGVWVLFAALVRPEFVLLVIGIAAAALVRSSARAATARVIGMSLLPAVVGGAAYLALHAWYFGDPLPNTYYAKRASDWEHARIGMDYVVSFVRAYPWVLLVLIGLASHALRPAVACVGAGLALFTIHIVRLGGDHFEFHRAFIHVLPICAALAGAGVARVFDESLVASSAARVWRPIVLAVSVVGMVFVSAQRHVRDDAFHWVPLAARLGAKLAEVYPPDTRVALFALGATGYTSGLPVVDALGIADKHVARQDLSHEHVCHLDIGHERGDPQYVLEKADVVVLFAAYAPVKFETLEEVREGFYSHKKFVNTAKESLKRGQLVLKNIEFMPGVYWAVLESTRP